MYWDVNIEYFSYDVVIYMVIAVVAHLTISFSRDRNVAVGYLRYMVIFDISSRLIAELVSCIWDVNSDIYGDCDDDAFNNIIQ